MKTITFPSNVSDNDNLEVEEDAHGDDQLWFKTYTPSISGPQVAINKLQARKLLEVLTAFIDDDDCEGTPKLWTEEES